MGTETLCYNFSKNTTVLMFMYTQLGWPISLHSRDALLNRSSEIHFAALGVAPNTSVCPNPGIIGQQLQ